MKKTILVLLVTVVSHAMFAQKYMTRTGKITFFSSTPVENIEAFNNEVASILDSKAGDLIFQVPVKSFKFEKALMQEHFNENFMETDKYPKSEFKGKITDIGDVNFAKDGAYNVKSEGKLTIHGVTKDVSMPGTVTVKGKDIVLNSKFTLKPADYKIQIPSVVASKIAKEIEVTVSCALNPIQK